MSTRSTVSSCPCGSTDLPQAVRAHQRQDRLSRRGSYAQTGTRVGLLERVSTNRWRARRDVTDEDIRDWTVKNATSTMCRYLRHRYTPGHSSSVGGMVNLPEFEHLGSGISVMDDGLHGVSP